MWQTLSSKEIFSHPRLSLIEDEVLLPNGNKTTYLKYKNKGNAATIICREKNGQILVQKEFSYPSNQELFQFPGGFIPAKEEIEIGTNRELMEEAKLYANSLKLLGSYLVDNRRSDAQMFVFLGTDLEARALSGDEEESIKSFWFTESEVEEMIIHGQIINVHTLASWSLYKLKG